MSGKIFIVGIGPGSYEKMTLEAVHALEASDEIIGYTVYTDLLKPHFPGKVFESTPMKQEIERCRLCFERALSGRTVSLVCSGDPGVYGMASPMFQLRKENSEYSTVELCVIPGVTAATSGSAVLGAPLNHDFCVISLSDLLTPWETIEKRLVAAVQGDFALAIYNPSSRKRSDYLAKACRIMIEAGADRDRACGFVRNIGRDGTEVCVCTLSELAEKEVDMFTTVFVGNSRSEIIFSAQNQPVLLTPRGYKI